MPSSDNPSGYPKVEPSVLIGIFPAAAVHVRRNAVTESEVLTIAYETAREMAEDRARQLRNEMESVREEEEDGDGGFLNGGASAVANGSASIIKRNRRPASLLLAQPREKEQPPLPALTAGDSTVAGQQWPLVDEIACAIREWYAVSRATRRLLTNFPVFAYIPVYARVPPVQCGRPAH